MYMYIVLFERKFLLWFFNDNFCLNFIVICWYYSVLFMWGDIRYDFLKFFINILVCAGLVLRNKLYD